MTANSGVERLGQIWRRLWEAEPSRGDSPEEHREGSEPDPVGKERRLHQRYPRLGEVFATWMGEDGSIQSAEIEVCDVSKSGMGLLSAAAIPHAAVVTVQDEGSMLVGNACHCVREERGYAIGIELVNSSYNDPPAFGKPKGPYVPRPELVPDPGRHGRDRPSDSRTSV